MENSDEQGWRDHPLWMGPAAEKKHYRDLCYTPPRVVDFDHIHGTLRVPHDLVEELEGRWNPLREQLQELHDAKVSSGEWGAVAVARWDDGGIVDFMGTMPGDVDHTCVRNRYRSNREVMRDCLEDKKRVRRVPDSLSPTGWSTVKERTWLADARDGYLFYDPTHTRTARCVAELLDSATRAQRIISDDHLNHVDHESTDELFTRHVQDTLRGSVLEGNDRLESHLVSKLFEREPYWCPECLNLEYDAPAALSEMGARLCYGCGHWFSPACYGDGAWVCSACLEAGVDPQQAAVDRADTTARRLARRLRGTPRRQVCEQGVHDAAALAAALLAYPLPRTPEFGVHQAGRAAQYWMGVLLPAVESRVLGGAPEQDLDASKIAPIGRYADTEWRQAPNYVVRATREQVAHYAHAVGLVTSRALAWEFAVWLDQGLADWDDGVDEASTWADLIRSAVQVFAAEVFPNLDI